MAVTHYLSVQLAPDNQPYQCIRLQNRNGMCIEIMDWGATWLSCQCPINGSLREVLLGCQLQNYPHQSAYLGASIGRYANRIANSQYQFDSEIISLVANQGKHQLHGGEGFSQRRWKVEKWGANFAEFSLFSENGDQGFPGNAEVKVSYRLTDNNEVEIEYQAQVDKTCPLNLTNHAYFNLDDGINGTDIRQHWLKINAEQYLPVDQEGIPNSPLQPVENTSFDFRQGKKIGQDWLQGDQILTQGYDHSFLINHSNHNDIDHSQASYYCATLLSSNQDLRLDVYSSQSALQCYTGNFLQGTANRQGGRYQNYSGVALETQCLPDSPNHPEWWQYGGITRANENYRYWTRFAFQAMKSSDEIK